MTWMLFLAACFPSRTAREANATYEWFHTAHNNIEAKVLQIRAQGDVLDAVSDPEENQRLRMELLAIQQSCRQLVSDYNANSDKVLKSVLMGTSLPDYVNLAVCEVGR